MLTITLTFIFIADMTRNQSLGNFKLEPASKALSIFLGIYNLINLVKNKTYFKGKGSSYIDLVLSNRKYCFKITFTRETK